MRGFLVFKGRGIERARLSFSKEGEGHDGQGDAMVAVRIVYSNLKFEDPLMGPSPKGDSFTHPLMPFKVTTKLQFHFPPWSEHINKAGGGKGMSASDPAMRSAKLKSRIRL